MADSQYGTIPYEVDEITSWMETYFNDNLPTLIIEAFKSKLTAVKFWSPVSTNFTLTTSPGIFTLNSIALPDLPDITIKTAHAIICIRQLLSTYVGENNAIACNLQCNKNSEGWITAVHLDTCDFRLFNNQPGLYKYINGSYDISSRVAFNETIDFRLNQASVAQNSVYVRGLQVGIAIGV